MDEFRYILHRFKVPLHRWSGVRKTVERLHREVQSGASEVTFRQNRVGGRWIAERHTQDVLIKIFRERRSILEVLYEAKRVIGGKEKPPRDWSLSEKINAEDNPLSVAVVRCLSERMGITGTFCEIPVRRGAPVQTIRNFVATMRKRRDYGPDVIVLAHLGMHEPSSSRPDYRPYPGIGTYYQHDGFLVCVQESICSGTNHELLHEDKRVVLVWDTPVDGDIQYLLSAA